MYSPPDPVQPVHPLLLRELSLGQLAVAVGVVRLRVR